MKRQALWLAVLAAFALPTGACNNDTTGIPPASPQAQGSTGTLRDVIVFFTYQFDPSGGLAAMTPDGTDRRRLTGGESGFEPMLSPDGRRIAFSRNTDVGVTSIYVMNVDGTGTIEVARGLVFNPGPVWSPDGCQIAYRSGFDQQVSPWIEIVNADGTGARQLTPQPDPNEFAYYESPTWSPDGSRLAFTKNAVLHVINADGTGLTALPNEDLALNPSWSPDGRRIAYTSLVPQGIHVRSADGSNLEQVTTAAEGAFDAW